MHVSLHAPVPPGLAVINTAWEAVLSANNIPPTANAILLAVIGQFSTQHLSQT